jgi:hypothetical protein
MKRQHTKYNILYKRLSALPANWALGCAALLLLVTEAILCAILVITGEESILPLLTAAMVFAFLQAIAAMSFVILRSESYTSRSGVKIHQESDTTVDDDEIRNLKQRLSSQVADLKRCLKECKSVGMQADAVMDILRKMGDEIRENCPITQVTNRTDRSIFLQAAIGAISNAAKSIVELPGVSSNIDNVAESTYRAEDIEKIIRSQTNNGLTDTPAHGIDTIDQKGENDCHR